MAKTLVLNGAAARTGAGRRLLPLLVPLFFLSGVSGLIYQVLWLRLLALVFGVTIHAASTVLAAFMAGLALGSFAAGRLVDRARSPLLWFGVAEGLVGLSALVTPAALEAVERLYVAIHPALSPVPGAVTAIRFACSFAVLLVPTTLMGASLPLIVKSSLARGGGLGERVGLLYGTNTAGAIAGTLLAGFVTIGGIGIGASFGLAAACNLLVAAVAVALALLNDRERAPDTGSDRPAAGARNGTPSRAMATTSPAGPVPGDRARRLVLVVFALSGFASLALEVVWFRILVLFLPVTTYAFTTMLATVLAGIAGGSWLVTPLLRRREGRDWLTPLALIELAIGVVALLSFAALEPAYVALDGAERLLGGRVPVTLLASALIVFPTALLLGVAFPIGLRLWARAGDEGGGGQGDETRDATGERIGLFYSLNVCGAIAGSLAAGFVLLPALGSRGSLVAVAALNLLGGGLLLGALPHERRPFALGAGAAGVILFLGAAIVLPDPFGIALARRYGGERLLWREEGAQTTVSVHEAADGVRILYLDGLHQANDTPDTIRVHRMIGHLPMAIHPRAREVLVIGLGGGATPGAVGTHPGAAVDVVELSETLVRGAAWFGHVNDDVLDRPNVRVHIDDGRNYLLLTPKRYDVITADIIRPYHAGAGNLYSAEYFRLARAALADDGIMVQWVDPANATQYELIVRTFLSVFPDATLWDDGRLLVGARGPLRLDPAAFERKLAVPGERAALATMGFDSFDALLAGYVAGPEELARFIGPGPILTDDRPRIEYFLSLPRDDRPADLTGVRGDPLRHVGR